MSGSLLRTSSARFPFHGPVQSFRIILLSCMYCQTVCCFGGGDGGASRDALAFS